MDLKTQWTLAKEELSRMKNSFDIADKEYNDARSRFKNLDDQYKVNSIPEDVDPLQQLIKKYEKLYPARWYNRPITVLRFSPPPYDPKYKEKILKIASCFENIWHGRYGYIDGVYLLDHIDFDEDQETLLRTYCVQIEHDYCHTPGGN